MSEFGQILGARLREVRVHRRLSMRELARRVGCSPSLISQIERGLSAPSAGILYSLANELNVSIDYLFDVGPNQQDEPVREPHGSVNIHTNGVASRSTRSPSFPQTGEASAAQLRIEHDLVQRGPKRRRIELSPGIIWERLTPNPDARVDFLEVHYAPYSHSTDSQPRVRHEGSEYQVVVEGELYADIGFETYQLTVGDSLVFDSIIPHQYRNLASVPARVISFVVHQSV
jgi:mannose-6-phosphate isomerase-like protein (cupin superfamily)